MTSIWRKTSRRIVREVIAQHGTDDEKVLRRALRGAYPFGERRNWPYKVWLDEIKWQTGKKPPLGTKTVKSSPGQMELFE